MCIVCCTYFTSLCRLSPCTWIFSRSARRKILHFGTYRSTHLPFYLLYHHTVRYTMFATSISYSAEKDCHFKTYRTESLPFRPISPCFPYVSIQKSNLLYTFSRKRQAGCFIKQYAIFLFIKLTVHFIDKELSAPSLMRVRLHSF